MDAWGIGACGDYFVAREELVVSDSQEDTFCLGDKQLPVLIRLSSWTKDAKLWSHLGEHLATAS